VITVKSLLAAGDDDRAVLLGVKKWKAHDADAKVPIGSG
jgi:hypothetical protein